MGSILYLIYLAGGYILGVDPAYAFTVQMDLEHDLRGGFTVFAEKLLQHPDNKLHGCEVVVEHDHLVHLWGLGALRTTF